MHETRGGAAIAFTIILPVIILVLGISIDFGRGHNMREVIQDAADAAALGAAAATQLNNDQKIALAKEIYSTNVADVRRAPQPLVSVSDGVVTVMAAGEIRTTFSRAAGYDELPISVVSRADMAPLKAEVVMVLDYSSSMTSGAGNGKERWEAMQDAAEELVKDITSNLTNPDVKLGLVPFAEDVYVSLPGEYVLGGVAGDTWTNCTKDQKWPHNATDEAPDPADDAAKWGRRDDDDVIDGGEYAACNAYPARDLVTQPLTSDQAGVLAQINAMRPHEGTNISTGISFGAQLISPDAPFTEGAAYGGDMRKIVVLLTDGEHTIESWGPGDDYAEEHGEDNTRTICNGLKAKGVLVVTVGYGLDSSGSRDLLNDCASPGQFYYDAEDGEALMTAFKDLGKRILGKARLLN